jgi:hypothetical protein
LNAPTLQEDLNPYQLAERLNRLVWSESWPHGNYGPEHTFKRGDSIPDILKIKDVARPEITLAPDDLLVVIEHRQNPDYGRRMLANCTAREVLTNSHTGFVRVLTVTQSGKSIQAADQYKPFGRWDANLDAFGITNSKPVRMHLATPHTRRFGYLGKVNDVRARLTSHPLYTDWQNAYAAALAECERERTERDASLAEAEALRAPYRAKIAELNRLAGEDLVELLAWIGSLNPDHAVHEGIGVVLPTNDWLTRNRLDVYLSGLHATGCITSDQHDRARQLLRELGLAPLQ